MDETNSQVCQTSRNGRRSPLIIIVATEGCLEKPHGLVSLYLKEASRLLSLLGSLD